MVHQRRAAVPAGGCLGLPVGGRGDRQCNNYTAPAKEGEPELTLHWEGDVFLGVTSSRRIRLVRPAAGAMLDKEGRQRFSRWLPYDIRLPRDTPEEGRAGSSAASYLRGG